MPPPRHRCGIIASTVARVRDAGPQKLVYLLTGSVAGAFSGLTGVGGGSIMVPLLTGQLKLGQHRAHGTSLAIIMFVACAGVAGYWRAGNIDWRLALALTPGALIGVMAGARTMLRVPAPQLRMLFGAFLFFVAFRQLVWEVEAGAPSSGATGLALDVAFGFVGGMLAGVLGVGGGAIFVPAIVIFGLAGPAGAEDPQKVAQGVSLVVIVATACAGTVTNARQDTIDGATVRWVAPIAMAAALAASLFANRLDPVVLKRIYGFTALGLGIETVATGWQALRKRPDVRKV